MIKHFWPFYWTLCLSLLVCFCRPVQARIYIDIDSPSGRKLPVAIVDLKILDDSLSAKEVEMEVPLFNQFRAVLERDLRMSGLIQVLDEDSHLEAKKAGISVNDTQFSLWRKIGADALVKGGIRRQKDAYSLEIRLFDVQQQSSILGKRYYFQEKSFKKVIHTFADEIILKLTGEAGVFATTRLLAVGVVNGHKEIFEMSVDGDDLLQLTRHRSISLAPGWSRDGRFMVYTSYFGGNPDLYLFDLQNNLEKRISFRPGLNLGGDFAPKKNLIALSMSNGSDGELVLINYKGEIVQSLTENWWVDIQPSWSPDGSQLAFVSNKSGQPDIYRCNADGSDVRRLTFKGFHNVSPAWSPRGDKIAFAGKDEGYFDIFIMDTDGSHIQRLTRSNRNNDDPSWAPNGQMLAFSSDRSRGREQIYVMGGDGSGQTQITDGSSEYSAPAWSPWLRK